MKKQQIKVFLFSIVVICLLSIPIHCISQPFLGFQSSWEIGVYQSVAPTQRTTVKALTTFHHDYTGTSHMGLVFERFKLGGYDVQAYSWAVEAGYAFDNFIQPIEIMPMANIGLMYSDTSRSNFRLQIGLDIAYRINTNVAFHIAYLRGRENYFTIDGSESREMQNTLTLGFSYRPYFKR